MKQSFSNFYFEKSLKDTFHITHNCYIIYKYIEVNNKVIELEWRSYI